MSEKLMIKKVIYVEKVEKNVERIIYLYLINKLYPS